jgi:hypothetical protein
MPAMSESSLPFEQALSIFDAGNAKPYAEALFRASFDAPFPVPREDSGLAIPTPPENWRQYVARYRWPDGKEETVGFCNWIKYREVYVEGGMCVDKTFYRRMPRDHFAQCRERGGVAQMMMETAARELNDCKAWFGYCGDAKAMAVDLRAGYVKTRHPHLIVKWFRELPADECEALVDSIAAIGPF